MSAYQVVARNFSAAHENKIHSDEIARKYGFRGALVPGVAVYGHLTHPLVERFGEHWLSHSTGSVRFHKPAYHNDRLSITLDETDDGYCARAVNQEGTLLAELKSHQPEKLPGPEDGSVFNAAAKRTGRIDMVWDAVHEGEPFKEWHFQVTDDMNQKYTSQIADELPLYHHLCHPHLLLAQANHTLTREYLMPAWIHVSSDIRFRELVRVGDTLGVHAVPLEKWERKGHQFVRLYITYTREHALTTEIFHTAIFKVAD